jgi:TrkA domain protein
MEIQDTPLPGVGRRYDLTTQRGDQLGVVSYRTGRRDLLLYDPDDPDTSREVVRLSQEEADALADLLGAARLTGHLAELQQQLKGLTISWLTIRGTRPMRRARSPTPRPAAVPVSPSWPCCAARRPSQPPSRASASSPATPRWSSAPRLVSGR